MHADGAGWHALSQVIGRLSTTRWNSRLGLLFDIAVALALFYDGLRGGRAPISALVVFSTGVALFTFIEYAFHRWLFHGPIALFEQGHRRHHEQPLGYDSLPFFLPPLAMLTIAGLLALLVPPRVALLFAAALATGYAAYGLSHSIIHVRRFRSSPARRWAAFHHVHHHHPDSNFGVTTPLWDIVFRTRHVSARKQLA